MFEEYKVNGKEPRDIVDTRNIVVNQPSVRHIGLRRVIRFLDPKLHHPRAQGIGVKAQNSSRSIFTVNDPTPVFKNT